MSTEKSAFVCVKVMFRKDILPRDKQRVGGSNKVRALWSLVA